ncbi:unnamed protein product [Amaranthus hypochondriacus]
MGYYDYYYYPYPRRNPSICDGLTLRPLPYPVILILMIISIFLAIKFYFVSEEAAEAFEFEINWLLIATPLILIFAVKLLSARQARCWWSHGGYSPAKCWCYECRPRAVAPSPPYYRGY